MGSTSYSITKHNPRQNLPSYICLTGRDVGLNVYIHVYMQIPAHRYTNAMNVFARCDSRAMKPDTGLHAGARAASPSLLDGGPSFPCSTLLAINRSDDVRSPRGVGLSPSPQAPPWSSPSFLTAGLAIFSPSQVLLSLLLASASHNPPLAEAMAFS